MLIVETLTLMIFKLIQSTTRDCNNLWKSPRKLYKISCLDGGNAGISFLLLLHNFL